MLEGDIIGDTIGDTMVNTGLSLKRSSYVLHVEGIFHHISSCSHIRVKNVLSTQSFLPFDDFEEREHACEGTGFELEYYGRRCRDDVEGYIVCMLCSQSHYWGHKVKLLVSRTGLSSQSAARRPKSPSEVAVVRRTYLNV